jgi:hypothetical protein
MIVSLCLVCVEFRNYARCQSVWSNLKTRLGDNVKNRWITILFNLFSLSISEFPPMYLFFKHGLGGGGGGGAQILLYQF